MLVTDLKDYIQRRYNAESDDHFSDALLYSLMYDGCLRFSRQVPYVQAVVSTTVSVASTQAYSFPTNAYALRRVEYDGNPLTQITFEEDDALTLSDAATLSTGTPSFYFVWNNQVYLRPVPDTSALVIKFYCYKRVTAITSASTLEIPEEYHLDLADYVLSEMYAKDKDFVAADRYLAKFERTIKEAQQNLTRNKRRTGPASVINMDTLPTTLVDSL